MISEIINIVNTKYSKYNTKECFDITQIKNFCNLYKPKNISTTGPDITLSDIDFSSPNISKVKISSNIKNNSKQVAGSKLGTIEFQKMYNLFIKLLYSCLKLDIEIFNENSDTFCVIKNNYQLIKSVEIQKKKFVLEHINILKNHCKNISKTDTNAYEKYVTEYILKMKIVDKLIGWINIFEKNDNLFSLILPYFYIYTEYIEEYIG